MSNPMLAVLVGPTAAGKSAIALQMAVEFGLEIVNADAFCLYRGMDIGTAKPSLDDQALVPHHLIDTHDVGDRVDVAEYQRLARTAIEGIWQRGRTPLLTGGSGLYVQAVMEQLDFPGTDPVVRARFEAELAEHGAQHLHRQLARIDPAAAEAILPSNGRRVVRALEVNEITGRPFLAHLPESRPWCDSLRVGWDPGVDVVDVAIETRVETMWRHGLVQEVRALADRMGPTASRAVGYRQILEVLADDADPDAARQPTVVATRQLARRQRRWFRRDRTTLWAESLAHVRAMFATLEV